MRIFALIHYPEAWRSRMRHPHDDGLEMLTAAGEIEDYIGFPNARSPESPSWAEIWNAALKEIQDQEPDAIVFQHFHGEINQVELLLDGIDRLKKRPVLSISSADPFSPDWRPPTFPECFRLVAKKADVVFLSAKGRCAQR